MINSLKKLSSLSTPATLRVTMEVPAKISKNFSPWKDGLTKFTKLTVRVNFEKDPALIAEHGPDLFNKLPAWATRMEGTPFCHHQDGRLYLRFLILETVQQYFKDGDKLVDPEEVQKHLPKKNTTYTGPIWSLISVENIKTCVLIDE